MDMVVDDFTRQVKKLSDKLDAAHKDNILTKQQLEKSHHMARTINKRCGLQEVVMSSTIMIL